MIELSGPPGSKVVARADKLYQIALSVSPPALASDPYYRERLRAHCEDRARARYPEPVQ